MHGELRTRSPNPLGRRGYFTDMGRFLGVLLGVLAVALLAVPAAGAAPDPAALAAELPTPSCAEGPERDGEVIVGTPCADRIVAPPSVAYVDGGPGDDTILAATSAGATSALPCATPPHCGVGSQEFVGGPGDDTVFGERGNDILRGGAGNDRLYGGIGDDLLEGGPGDDILSGGFGADAIDGGEGSDLVRGDATVDSIVDTGGPTDTDTLSYATGATPGFGNSPPYDDLPPYPNFSAQHPGFPPTANGRGVYLDLGAAAHGNGFNGGAATGGGADDVAGSDFERIIGSPFADYIVGSKPGQQIFGGGGGDVLISGGAGTQLFGGADGDDCIGEATTTGCESTASTGPVSRAEPARVEVGEMAEGATDLAELYLLGVDAASPADAITVTTAGEAPSETVTFTRSGGSEFAPPAPGSGCALQVGGAEVVCAPGAPLDSVTVAGLGGNDALAAPGLGETTSLVLLGGEGADQLTGGAVSDDTLVDGSGDDVLHGGGGDDALVDAAGRDQLFGEAGNDLLIATVLCEGDRIDGGEGRDNASWAKLATPAGVGVDARLDEHAAGQIGPGGQPECPGPGGIPDELVDVEDLEGSPLSDVLYGDAGPNQLLGHSGEDSYFAGAGEDSILANSGSRDAVIDCGSDLDRAIVDLAAIGDPTPIECERVNGAAPGEYEVPPELVPPPESTPPPATSAPPETSSPPPAATNPKPPRVDRTPPRTKLLRRPAKLIRVRPHRAARVVFRFGADERSRFECKLDRHPYRRCHSPLRTHMRRGRHTFRVFAVDAAGNRDRTPALVRVRVVVTHPHPR